MPALDTNRLTKITMTRHGDKWTVVEEREGEQNGETFSGMDDFYENLFHFMRRYDWRGGWRL